MAASAAILPNVRANFDCALNMCIDTISLEKARRCSVLAVKEMMRAFYFAKV